MGIIENRKECKKLIDKLERKPYFSAALEVYDDVIEELVKEFIDEGMENNEAEHKAHITLMSLLTDVMRKAEPKVEAVIQKRVADGEIDDPNQARKSAAGNVFQQMVAYCMAENIINGNLHPRLVVKMSGFKDIIDQYASIRIGDDVQQPDTDVLVYDPDDEESPIVIFSCKTSLRERAGQTYKWKLMCDLATCKCEHMKDNPECTTVKYGLEYEPTRPVKMCIITADFYNEISNPQIHGIFNFFDYSYITKEIEDDNIIPLENVIADLNALFPDNNGQIEREEV